MTVYLKGLDGRPKRVERYVKEIAVDDKRISIRYEDGAYGSVVGRTYSREEWEIAYVEE